jgi:phage-related tail protein
MKIYSEKTRKEYTTVEECLEAEAQFDAAKTKEEQKKKVLSENRKKRANEVEEAYKKMLEAQKTYCKLRNEFIREYGSYHMTFSIDSDDFHGFFEDVFRII